MMGVGAFRPSHHCWWAPLSPSQPRVRCGGARTKRGGCGGGGGGGGSSGFGAAAEATTWRCAPGCGACCKLDKGPAFPTPEEIFHDNHAHLRLYKSLVGPDGWCVHYQHATRTCSIYADRPFFCRVKPDVFWELFGIDERRFNKEACSSCRDTIKAIYGSGSDELKNFNHNLRHTMRDVTTANNI